MLRLRTEKGPYSDIMDMISHSWKNGATWACDSWCLNEGPTEYLYDEAAKALEEANGNVDKASRLLAVKIKEAVKEASPLKEEDFFSLILMCGLQTIDFEQVATAIIGDLGRDLETQDSSPLVYLPNTN